MRLQAAKGKLFYGSVDWRAQLKAARWLWVSLLVFGLTRLGIALVAYISVPLLIDPSTPPRPYFRPNNTLVDAFGGRWDTGFYVDIATQGYKYKEVPLPWVAFFPLLPLLIRAVTPLVGDPLVAGLIVSNTALLGATMLLYRLAEEAWGSAVADRSVWYLLIFPTSFFGSTIYTESLFLLSTIGALYLARRRQWLGAAAFGVLAALARPTGVLVAPMLLVEWWTQWRRADRARPSLAALLAPAAVPLGTLAYMFYLDRAFGDPLAFLHAQAAWGRENRSVFSLIEELMQRPQEGWGRAILASRLPLDGWIELVHVLFFAILGCALLYRRLWSEATLVLLGTLIVANSGRWMSQRRHLWVLFPVFILLAIWGERRWVDRAITTFFLVGLALFTAMFVNWYWVG